jgi:hypothetical protein
MGGWCSRRLVVLLQRIYKHKLNISTTGFATNAPNAINGLVSPSPKVAEGTTVGAVQECFVSSLAKRDAHVRAFAAECPRALSPPKGSRVVSRVQLKGYEPRSQSRTF